MKYLIYAAGACLLAVAPAHAAVLTVSSADVTRGETTLKTGFSWSEDDEDGAAQELVIEAAHSPTSFWTTAIEVKGADGDDSDPTYKATAWKNTLQFMKQDEANAPLSMALRLQYEIDHREDRNNKGAVRLLLRHQSEALETRVNLGVEKETGSGADDATGDLRASLRYKLNDHLRPAIDYLGDTGSLDETVPFEEQDHRLGVVMYGSVDKKISYEAGVLAGISEAAPDQTFKLALNYKF